MVRTCLPATLVYLHGILAIAGRSRLPLNRGLRLRRSGHVESAVATGVTGWPWRKMSALSKPFPARWPIPARNAEDDMRTRHLASLFATLLAATEGHNGACHL